MQTMTEKDQYLASLERESATTLKLMRIYPADQLAFKPAAKSSTAHQLFWTFTVELKAAMQAVDGAVDFAIAATPPPGTLAELVSAYEATVKEAMAKIRGASEAQLGRLITVPVGPKQTGQVPAMAFIWMMLMDCVHHRGQLSVYLRVLDCKVPSIYGPSADEPWN